MLFYVLKFINPIVMPGLGLKFRPQDDEGKPAVLDFEGDFIDGEEFATGYHPEGEVVSCDPKTDLEVEELIIALENEVFFNMS